MPSFFNADQIKASIAAQTQGRWIGSQRKFLGASDRNYWSPARGQITGMLKKAHIRHEGQVGEAFDCDDYAVVLKARMSYVALKFQNELGNNPIALGIVWCRCSWNQDEKHAANWILDDSSGLVLIEPQYNNAAARSTGLDPMRPPTDEISDIEVMMF